jgi:cytochrome c-type biogenesis protein CcmF
MLLAHAGVGVFIIGVTMVKSYETAIDVRMAPGDTASVGGYTFTFVGIEELNGPNYIAARARVELSRDGQPLGVMHPEKRIHTVQKMPMTEAAIDSGIFRDLYVALGEPVDIQTWILRIQHKPLVGWIWWGCVLMALGGLLAATDRRYRIAARSNAESDATAQSAGIA